VNWLPLILRMQLAGPKRRSIRLWVPLFIVWPILLVLAIVTLPLLLLVAIVLILIGRAAWLRTSWALCRIVVASRGLQIDTYTQAGQRVFVSLE